MDGRAAERIWIEYVSDNYFDVLLVEAARGRTFLPGEGRRPGDAPFVVLTHRAWQTRFGGDPDVLGQVVRVGPGSMTVIGVTPEAFAGTSGVVPVELFGPRHGGRAHRTGVDGAADQPAPGAVRVDGTAAARRASATLHVHTDGPASAATAMVTETLRRPEPTLAIFDAGSMDAAVRSKPLLVSVRLGAAVIGSFGALGLLLTAVGLYGVVSHAVAQRRQEFGIRAALGATSAAITRLALGRGVVLTTLGLPSAPSRLPLPRDSPPAFSSTSTRPIPSCSPRRASCSRVWRCSPVSCRHAARRRTTPLVTLRAE